MDVRSQLACASRRSSLRILAGFALVGYLTACASGPSRDGSETVPAVYASAETEPVRRRGDAADDPAILVSASGNTVWIAGTDKQFGLRIYDLGGTELHALATGRLNNVDATPLGDDRFLLAASNRTTISIDLYVADLTKNTIELAESLPLSFEEPYGLCMAPDQDGFRVFVGDKTGQVDIWRVDRSMAGERLKTLTFDSQTEGCVFDITSDTLFVGEEVRGIWAVNMTTGERRLLDEIGAGRLTADVEGLDIYADADRRLLLASSQGDNTFVVYDLVAGQPLLKFRIDPSLETSLDGVSETDGVAITTASVPGYEQGILVVQDGRNTRPRARQNFKIVDWREIDLLL